MEHLFQFVKSSYDEAAEYAADNTFLGDLFAMKYIGMAKSELASVPVDKVDISGFDNFCMIFNTYRSMLDSLQEKIIERARSYKE